MKLLVGLVLLGLLGLWVVDVVRAFGPGVSLVASGFLGLCLVGRRWQRARGSSGPPRAGRRAAL